MKELTQPPNADACACGDREDYNQTAHVDPKLLESRRVLVVDDDSGGLMVLSRILTAHGFETFTATSVASARALLNAQHFDIVLVDIIMPGESGFVLLDEIAHLAPRTIAIVLTGIQDVDGAVAALRRGAYDYLRKPFTGDSLILATERCLRHRRMQLECDAKRVQVEQLLSEHLTERDQLAARLEQAQSTVFAVAGLVAEWKGVGGIGHLNRVSAICRELALALPDSVRSRHQIDAAYAMQLGNAARLHDIGHVGLPAGIIDKPGPLTDEEFATVKRHPELGCDVLNAMWGRIDPFGEPTLAIAVEVCRTHHERWNGSGYPSGLKGEDIPIAGRIAGLADYYDAITSIRPYRTERASHESAVERIQTQTGRGFDPTVVEAFLKIGSFVSRVRDQYPDDEDGPNIVGQLPSVSVPRVADAGAEAAGAN